MKIYFLVLLVAFSAEVAAEKMETSEIVLSIINDPATDEHSCRRALSMSEGKIKKSMCEEALPKVKESCASAVNNFIGMHTTTEEQSRYIARTLMLCQVWELLGYETITTENGVQYIKQPGGVLP